MKQALEDKFDGKNRMNLRHFIRHANKDVSNVGDDQSSEDHDTSYYFLQNDSSSYKDQKIVDEKTVDRTDLQRIPSCAVFHKIASGQGVPHTFIGK